MKNKTTVELIDIPSCSDKFEEGLFHMTLAATVRAREIQTSRLKSIRRGDKVKRYSHGPIVQSLIDVQNDMVDNEYLGVKSE